MSPSAGLPTVPEIHEEPIRPLLTVLEQTGRATLRALDAEHPVGWPDPDADAEEVLDAATCVEVALAAQIEGLLKTLRIYAQALRQRHSDLWRHRDCEV